MKHLISLIFLIIVVVSSCKQVTDSKFNGTWIDKSTETGTLEIKNTGGNKFSIKVNGREIEGTLIDDTLEFTADSKVQIKYDVNDQLLIDNKHQWIRPEKSRKNNYLGVWKRANFFNQPTLVKGGFLKIGKDENVIKVEEGHVFKGELTHNSNSKFDRVVLQDSMLIGTRLIRNENSNKKVYRPQEITLKINGRGMLELTANGETEKFQKKS